MSPLALLLLFGFMFVIALCLTVWAALSWVTGPRTHDGGDEVTYVPLSRPVPEGNAWRTAGTSPAMAAAEGDPTGATASGGTGNVTVRQRRNDDFRGANATVTQRPNLDDAFDRFLYNERKDRN